MPAETAAAPAVGSPRRRSRARAAPVARAARALGGAARRPARRHGDRRPGALARVPDRRLVHDRLARPVRGRADGAGADARDRRGGDRPLGRVGARALERADGRPVERRPAARADHADLPRRRRAVRRVQRPARDAPRPAVARRHDRHARAVPRPRLRGHRRRVGDRLPRHLDRPRVRQLRRHVHPEHDGAVRDPRRRVRGAAARDAVRPLDLRDRRQRGGRVLLRPARQARSS